MDGGGGVGVQQGVCSGVVAGVCVSVVVGAGVAEWGK